MAKKLSPDTAIKDPNGLTWGMHPISWRNDDIPEVGEWNTLEILLDDLVTLGFAGTECAGFFPSPEVLKKEIDARDEKIAAQWFSSFIVRDGVDAVAKDFEQTCANLEYVNAPRVVVSEQTGSVQGIRDVSIFSNKPVMSEAEWTQLVRGLEVLGDIAHRHNMELVYHHHLGTVVMTADETKRLMDMTDPSKVSLLFDTGHAYVGDGSVMAILEQNIDRIKHVHFKDVRPRKLAESKAAERSFLDSFLAGMFTVPGDGIIDFPTVYRYLIDHGYQGWILVEAEQDPEIAKPLMYGRMARDYIEKELFA
ncbi:myo-inosose-2 dehydratase [Propionibacterium freudenreichii]|uniref:myo-inosose-2 dehydratase n=1 Tax=Propionibacterium freudenreichii TaxID=1744 RepID=UPI00254E8521|nr:myo-inosose-2 dehydratase [Propionibacterium freudenreichii]MDK9349670.1 myo-inosose-2 dehydratase [Propionibacterium freudenreichii]